MGLYFKRSKFADSDFKFAKAKIDDFRSIRTNVYSVNISKYIYSNLFFKKFVIVFSFFLLTNKLNAQIVKYSNEFLSIGAGAKAFGMANSCISSVNDASASYWNPANLLIIEQKYQFIFMHSNYFAGMANYDYLCASYKYNDSLAFGCSLIRFGVDDIQNTLDLIDNNGNFNYNNISTFSVTDYALLLSVAKQTKINGLRVGGNVKLIYRIQGEFATAYGFGFDISASYKFKGWNIAAVLKDATSTFNAWIFDNSKLENTFLKTGNQLPENSLEITVPKLIIGISKEFLLSEKFFLQPEINIDVTFDGKRNVLFKSDFINFDPHVGFELNYSKSIFLRGGIGNIYTYTDFDGKIATNFQPSLGIGFRFGRFTFDYAITELIEQSNSPYSNIFSIRYGLNYF